MREMNFEDPVFVFNRYDRHNNEYVCTFHNGTHHVFIMDRPEGREVFSGSYDACSDYVENEFLESYADII